MVLCGAREEKSLLWSGRADVPVEPFTQETAQREVPCGDPENNKVAIGENQCLTVDCRATAWWRSNNPQMRRSTNSPPLSNRQNPTPFCTPHHPPQHTHTHTFGINRPSTWNIKVEEEEETHYIPFSWKEFLLSLEVKCELNAGILKNFQQPLK